jgi:hypothetical protein
MKRLALLALFAFVATVAPALAGPRTLTVSNQTVHCAYVSLTVATSTGPWYFANGGTSGPRAIPPGQTYVFAGGSLAIGVNGPDRIRVRAEVYPGAPCSGNKYGDYTILQTGLHARPEAMLHAKLVNSAKGMTFVW